jgi:hypothetical protein
MLLGVKGVENLCYLTSVADPDHFDADPDTDPTSEKARMRIRILDQEPDPIMLYIKFFSKIFLL